MGAHWVPGLAPGGRGRAWDGQHVATALRHAEGGKVSRMTPPAGWAGKPRAYHQLCHTGPGLHRGSTHRGHSAKGHCAASKGQAHTHGPAKAATTSQSPNPRPSSSSPPDGSAPPDAADLAQLSPAASTTGYWAVVTPPQVPGLHTAPPQPLAKAGRFLGLGPRLLWALVSAGTSASG